MDKKVISFPRFNDYHVPIEFLIKKVTNHKVLLPPPITKKTLEIGSKYSPDFVCVPFKYNLGNYIEVLDQGASVIMQAGGGCRYGYYAEIQEQILKDLGYNFEFYCLTDSNKFVLSSVYQVFKKLNNKMSFLKFFYYLILTLKMIHYMDKIDIYIRSNIGFEKKKGSFDNLKEEMLNEYKTIKGFCHLYRTYKKYDKAFKKIEINKSEDCLKVGIIGELYTSIEPFSSYQIEKNLAKMNVEVTRYTDVTYLVISKMFNVRKILKICGKYCKYTIGADGTDNVAEAINMARRGYDGLIHTKPFGCTPEVGAMPILQKVSIDLGIPIIFLSFDSHTSEEGIKTRMEAFYDMLIMRRNKK